MECVVVHRVSGRVRLRVPEIHGDEELGAALAGWIAKRDGVSNCRVNTLCASVVICYDDAATGFPDHLQAAIGELERPERELILPAHAAEPDPWRAWLTWMLEFLERPKSLLWPTSSLALALAPAQAAALALPLMAINAYPTWKRAFLVVK